MRPTNRSPPVASSGSPDRPRARRPARAPLRPLRPARSRGRGSHRRKRPFAGARFPAREPAPASSARARGRHDRPRAFSRSARSASRAGLDRASGSLHGLVLGLGHRSVIVSAPSAARRSPRSSPVRSHRPLGGLDSEDEALAAAASGVRGFRSFPRSSPCGRGAIGGRSALRLGCAVLSAARRLRCFSRRFGRSRANVRGRDRARCEPLRRPLRSRGLRAGKAVSRHRRGAPAPPGASVQGGLGSGVGCARAAVSCLALTGSIAAMIAASFASRMRRATGIRTSSASWSKTCAALFAFIAS